MAKILQTTSAFTTTASDNWAFRELAPHELVLVSGGYEGGDSGDSGGGFGGDSGGGFGGDGGGGYGSDGGGYGSDSGGWGESGDAGASGFSDSDSGISASESAAAQAAADAGVAAGVAANEASMAETAAMEGVDVASWGGWALEKAAEIGLGAFIDGVRDGTIPSPSYSDPAYDGAGSWG